MKLDSIKTYLKPYLIYQKRKTTINHAFAAALAPYDNFDRSHVAIALEVLGQTDADNLTCVYCDAAAEEWDHLTSIVKDSQLNGFGHQIGNLVPCCSRCNRSKGGKEWQEFLDLSALSASTREARRLAINSYLAQFAIGIDLSNLQQQTVEWNRYSEIRMRIFQLMQEADSLAALLRNCH